MVGALPGDKCYVNTRYYSMFFSNGGLPLGVKGVHCKFFSPRKVWVAIGYLRGFLPRWLGGLPRESTAGCTPGPLPADSVGGAALPEQWVSPRGCVRGTGWNL